MKIYLDNCSLQRPLDDRSQPRIALEAEAVLTVLSLCGAGKGELVSSEALRFEINRNPLEARRHYALEVLAEAGEHIESTSEIEERAREFTKLGVKALDALHLAFAEAAGVDCFCTCDDRLFRRAQTIPDLTVTVVTPLTLAAEMTHDS